MKFGRYEIISELGKGAMGIVHLAYDPQIDRQVALKVLRKDKDISDEFVLRFLKEAKAIGRLSHANIVTVYDVGQDHDTIYITMEFLEGEPFDKVVSKGGLGHEEAINIIIQLAGALDYAHQKGVVHRDIKPSNIIFSGQESVKLTDFGIARFEDSSASLQTQAGEILGTPAYMSPEQVNGQAVDGRSDLFSLGVILYELIVGAKPFQGNNLAAIFNAITSQEPEAPDKNNPFVSKKLSNIIMQSLAKEPGRRFQTGSEMAAALKECLQDTRSTGQMPNQQKKKSANPLFFMILVLVIGLIVGGYYLWPKPGQHKLPEKQMQTNSLPDHSASSTPVPKPAQTQASSEIITKPETLPKVFATIKINSVPDKASIYVDKDLKGKTPMDLKLPIGIHELRLNLPEHFEWQAQVQLSEKDDVPLFIQLIPVNQNL